MKTRSALCLALLFATVGLRADDASSPLNQATAAERAEHPTPESILATEVSEIASSSTLSPKAKAKQVSRTVRRAVIAATTDVREPKQALKIALSLASEAAKAAPLFTEAIRDAIFSIPSIASIRGALAQLDRAVEEGAKAAMEEPSPVMAAGDAPRPAPIPTSNGGGDVVVASPSH